MGKKPGIAIVILAAGASERMKRPKQLLPWGETTLLGHSIAQCLGVKAVDLDSDPDLFVVLGARYEEIKEEADRFPVTVLRHEQWADGIGSSVAFAARHFLGLSNDYGGMLITLADQPLFDPEYYGKLIGRFETGNRQIVATSYDGKPGVPALIDASYFPELSRLTGDTGAKNLLLRHRGNVSTVEAGQRTLDIDTPEAYRKQHHRFFGI